MHRIRYPDGTEVWVTDVPAEPETPAHARRGRFDKLRKPGQTERQRIESGLGRMFKAGKAFLLDEDEDDLAVAAKLLKKATDDET